MSYKKLKQNPFSGSAFFYFIYLSLTIFPIPPSTICTVNLCAHRDPAFIACISPVLQEGYSLIRETYLPSLLVIEFTPIWLSTSCFFSANRANRDVQSSCALTDWQSGSWRDHIPSCQSPNLESTSVWIQFTSRETRLHSANIPYPCPPVAGLQDWATSPEDWVGGRNQTRYP